MATPQFAGPVDYVVFVFDEHSDLGPGLSALLERIEQGIIEVLDIELLARETDGSPIRRVLTDLDGVTGIDVSIFDGAESGVLDADDLAQVVEELTTEQVALVIVYEDRSLATAANAWGSAGGVELFSGGVDLNDLEHAPVQAQNERNPS